MSSSTETTPSKAKFFGFDHVHFWVGNALQAAAFYSARFGFQKIAYRGLETGSRDVVTHVIKQGKIVLAFSSPLRPGNKEMGDHMMQHGDGVKDIAMTVSDARAIWQKATAAGAVSVQEPTEMSDEHGKVVLSSVKTYGDTIHTFVSVTHTLARSFPDSWPSLAPRTLSAVSPKTSVSSTLIILLATKVGRNAQH
eukprot:TRINITY_DN3822_c0_g1_i1.p1 TRINITY_DN3822_c0_g1~~TRINITY_DN3822_c0_g1_i1.p1  ORF type:complete len:217 (+),score=87.56 TRINITY_DN3822_c0_g1_i1:68-652(+)